MAETKKKQIITIAGRPGSGKSTAARGVAEALGYQHFSSGDLFRAIAKEWGVDVLQANVSAEDNYKIDHLVDGRLQEIYAVEDQLVIDSRMAWHFMPASFKVFLDLDLEIAAVRILAKIDKRRLVSEHIPSDPAEYAQTLRNRLKSETGRYKKLYDADPYDMSNYDLIINTATSTAEQTLEQILEHYRSWHS